MIAKSSHHVLMLLAIFHSFAFATEECAPLLGSQIFFYKVERAGGTGLLLGTEHIKSDLVQFPKFVHEAIERADDVTLEVKSDPGIFGTLATVAMFFNLRGPRLSQRLSKKAWGALVKKFPGIPPSILNRLSPLGATFLNHSAQDIKGLDDQIRRRARELGVRVRGLEKASDQRRLMVETFSLKNLEELLLAPKSAAPPAQPFSEGDERAAKAEVDKMRRENPEFWKAALVYRNLEWLPKIEKTLARAGQHFIAVGSHHLPGEYGLIAQLRRRGYTVTRIKR